MTPLALMAIPVRLPGALPLIVAEFTPKPVANCVIWLRSRLTVCPPGTGIDNGEPLGRAPVVGLKLRVCDANGPEEYGNPPPAAAVPLS